MREIDSNNIILGLFNITLSKLDKKSTHKINKKNNTTPESLNGSIDHMDLTDTYKPFHKTAAEMHTQSMSLKI